MSDGFGRAGKLHLVSFIVRPFSEAKWLNKRLRRYAFAPASVVAPLGTTALIANCFIAPLMLHERFRKKDILGIAFSIAGAVTIVLSSKSENKSVGLPPIRRAKGQAADFDFPAHTSPIYTSSLAACIFHICLHIVGPDYVRDVLTIWRSMKFD